MVLSLPLAEELASMSTLGPTTLSLLASSCGASVQRMRHAHRDIHYTQRHASYIASASSASEDTSDKNHGRRAQNLTNLPKEVMLRAKARRADTRNGVLKC